MNSAQYNLTKCGDLHTGVTIQPSSQVVMVASSENELTSISSTASTSTIYVIPINGYVPQSISSNIKVLSGDLKSIALQDRSVDTVICSYNIYSHLNGKDIENEFHRIQKEHGDLRLAAPGCQKGKKNCGGEGQEG